ncbi:MAG: NAD(+)/NADH kinase, partial [Pirellulaceae bacterium]
EGRYAIDSHLMLACCVDQKNRWSSPHLGLNEVAILGGPPYTILEIDLYVDGDLATTYRCDGLILSTPVGSTAHNLSAGGPILQKNLQAFVICPISPHTLTMRPVVDSADRVFELVVRNPGPSTSVVVDGRVIASCQEATRIRVQRASQPFTMVRVGGQNDYVRLRDKLGWSGSAKGIRPTSRPRTPEEP